MGDTFTSIIVGECLPAKAKEHKGARPFEDEYADAQSLFASLNFNNRAHTAGAGRIWLQNLWHEPGKFRDVREAAAIKWQNSLSEAPNGGLWRARKRDINILATSNYAGQCLARAHGFNSIPKLGEAPVTWQTGDGGTWRFILWYRGEIRADQKGDLARAFLEGR